MIAAPRLIEATTPTPINKPNKTAAGNAAPPTGVNKNKMTPTAIPDINNQLRTAVALPPK